MGRHTMFVAHHVCQRSARTLTASPRGACAWPLSQLVGSEDSKSVPGEMGVAQNHGIGAHSGFHEEGCQHAQNVINPEKNFKDRGRSIFRCNPKRMSLISATDGEAAWVSAILVGLRRVTILEPRTRYFVDSRSSAACEIEAEHACPMR